MAEYIDRGDLTIWLNKKSCEFSMNDVAPIGWTLKGLVNELATFPSADVVERKTGKWIYPSDIIGFGRCSECKALWDYSLMINKSFKICPRCGSYNRGDDDV